VLRWRSYAHSSQNNARTPMTSRSRDKAVSDAFRFLRLDSVKRRIMLFAIVATLLPALTTTGLSYAHNKRALKEKTTAELLNASALIARESRLWLKERFYDVRVFSSSYEVSENLEHVVRGSGKAKAARQRLETYLESVRGRFTHYEELTVFDLNAKVVASSGAGSPLVIAKSWLAQIKKDKGETGDPQLDGKLGKITLPIVVSVRSSSGKLLGGFAAKLNLNALNSAVREISHADGQQVYVLKENGAILVNAHSKPENLLEPWLGPETIDSLMNSNSPSLEYENERGDDVLGTLERVPQLNWIVIAEIPVAQAYSQIRDLRNQTALVVSLLLIGIGSIAYVLGASIARPLDRLIKGAGRVADGDLAVTISTGSKGELGYLTRVFNDMVERLRAGREELERISITDSLTGIYNRKYLNEKLADHVTYARDGDSTFTILMIDVDHFKAYNDTYGHVAGDKVLSRLGPLLKAQLRSSGFVARYGGEEFFALLPDADADDAVKVAERIRTAVADEPFGESGDEVRLTLSIGVATFENRGETSESIIAAADKALYRAKKNGRNRVTKARRKAAA
jgi:diguanylate cyclase (GGDEF)-like protein